MSTGDRPLSPVEQGREVFPNVANLLGTSATPSRRCSEGSGMRPPLVIGVCGQSASGKTTVCARIRSELLAHADVVVLPLDSFYRTPPPGTDFSCYDFDHPDALDFDEFVRALDRLSSGLPAQIPEYSFTEHRRVGFSTLNPAPVVITEGILLFTDQRILQRLHVKIFVDTDSDECLRRRILRDTKDRGRDLEGVLEQYCRFVRPSVEKFVLPSRASADFVIPRGYNPVAVDLVKGSLIQKLSAHGDDVSVRYPQVRVVPHSLTVKSIHSIIRDKTTHTRDFIFYTDRLTRITLEYALGLAAAASENIRECAVTTPDGHVYDGVSVMSGDSECNAGGLCVVSAVRAGETMEAALRQLVPGVPVGKLMLTRTGVPAMSPVSPAAQGAVGGEAGPSDSSPAAVQPTRRVKVGEEVPGTGLQVKYLKLPPTIASSKTVLLLDPVVGDGRALMAAVRVLLDAGVSEKALCIVSLIASQRGLERVARAFPGLLMVSSEIDPRCDADGNCVPGVGDIAARYFASKASGY